MKSLRSTYEKTQQQLRDKERELAAVQAENQTLRLQVVPQTQTLSVGINMNPRVSTDEKTPQNFTVEVAASNATRPRDRDVSMAKINGWNSKFSLKFCASATLCMFKGTVKCSAVL